jgi:hypothetical protein
MFAICERRVDGSGLTGNIDLVLRRSVDAGRTWQPLQKIADLGDDTLGNPCPVVDRETGTIRLPFTHSPGQFNETQIVAGQSSGPTTVWVTRSDNDGATWSERDISAKLLLMVSMALFCLCWSGTQPAAISMPRGFLLRERSSGARLGRRSATSTASQTLLMAVWSIWFLMAAAALYFMS